MKSDKERIEDLEKAMAALQDKYTLLAPDVAHLSYRLGRPNVPHLYARVIESSEQCSGWLPVANHQTLSADGTPFSGTVGRSGRLVAWQVAVYVATTNDAANYWTIRLLDAAAGIVSAVNTSAIAANTWAVLTVDGINTTLGPTTTKVILVTATKTLTPGDLTICCPACYLV